MRYELMFPWQIRKAIDENWPVVLPTGVLEYHGEHCVTGVDTLVVVRAFDLLEKEMNIVILPPFYYGASSYAVAKPERNGSVHVDAEAILPFAKQLFQSLLRIGFKNIHLFLHHQSENFNAGMPTDLSLRLAARQTIFAFLEKERGEDWWGGASGMKDYYERHEAGDDPFSWISVHPFMSTEIQKKYPIDHAGKQEVSLMLAFCPEGVDMARHSKEQWYAETAQQASDEYGNAAKAEILASLKKMLSKK